MKKFIFTLITMLSITNNVWSNDGDIFYANTTEGIQMRFKVVSEEGKTCQVASSAIDLSTSGTVTIPSIANGYTIVCIGDDAFCQCDKIKKVTIPESVELIGAEAFYGCSSLESILIPDFVTDIQNCAFAYCTNLSEVSIGKAVNSISSSYLHDAFDGCNNIKKLTVNCRDLEILPSSLKNNLEELIIGDNTVNIGYYTFYNYNSKLRKLSIGKSVDWIGGFRDCSLLEEVELSEGNMYIQEEAFNGCEKLSNLSLPSTIKTIGSVAFSGCGFNQFTIPEGVEEIGYGAFSGCKNLTSINIPNNVNRLEIDLFSGCGFSSFDVPSHVTSIGMGTFRGCSKLETVTASDNLISIGRDAFMDVPWYDNQNDGLFYLGSVACGYHGEMSGSTTIQLRDNTRGIAACAFAGQTNLTKITFPVSLENIGDAAFQNCTGLTSIVIPEKLENMGCEAFSGCTNLKRIDFHVTPTTCYNFICCKNLKAIYAYMEQPKEIYDMFGNDDDEEASQDYVFNNATLYVPSEYISAYENTYGWKRFKNIQPIQNNISFADEEVKAVCVANWDINEDMELSYNEATSVTSLSDAFSNNEKITSFKELEFFTGLTAIDDYAFTYCSNLKEVTIPENVTTIGTSSFASCHHLDNLVLPGIVSSVGNEAFMACVGMQNLSLSEGLKIIGEAAFSGCNQLKQITLPEGIETINAHAFEGCGSLISVVIPKDVSLVGEAAFAYCNKLESIFVGEGITRLGSEVFSGCEKLKDVSLPSSLTEVSYGMFSMCNSLESIVLPELVTSIGSDAFHWCANLKAINIPNGVTMLGINAFAECSSLTEIVIPKNVSVIHSAAFQNCYGLEKVVSCIENPFDLDASAFWNWNEEDQTSRFTSAILYVPRGQEAIYLSTIGWKEFSQIVEYGDELSLSDIEGRPGKQVELPITLTNDQTVVGISFTLRLPQGVEVATDEDGDPIFELNSERMSSKKFSTTTMCYEDGSWGFRIASTSSDTTVNGNEGDIVTIMLNIAKGMEDGDYTISLTDNVLSIDRGDHDIQSLPIHDATATLTLNSLIMGDVNGDEEVDLSDAIMVTYYSLNVHPTNFIVAAADMNTDGHIDLSDAIIITYMSLGVYGNDFQMPQRARSVIHREAGQTERVYAETMTMQAGQESPLEVKYEIPGDLYPYVGFMFFVDLPEGLSLVEDSDNSGYPWYDDTVDAIAKMTITTSEENGFAATPRSANATIKGNEGVLMRLMLKADDMLAPGSTHTVTLRDVSLNVRDDNYNVEKHPLDNVSFTVTIGQPTGIGGDNQYPITNSRSADAAYDLQGRKLNNGNWLLDNGYCRKGVNILRMNDGTTQKVVVK